MLTIERFVGKRYKHGPFEVVFSSPAFLHPINIQTIGWRPINNLIEWKKKTIEFGAGGRTYLIVEPVDDDNRLKVVGDADNGLEGKYLELVQTRDGHGIPTFSILETSYQQSVEDAYRKRWPEVMALLDPASGKWDKQSGRFVCQFEWPIFDGKSDVALQRLEDYAKDGYSHISFERKVNVPNTFVATIGGQ